jgi:hypothetical protein
LPSNIGEPVSIVMKHTVAGLVLVAKLALPPFSRPDCRLAPAETLR